MKVIKIIRCLCCLLLPVSWVGIVQAQETLNKTVNLGGLDRQFIVYLPKNFTHTESLPVLLCFHAGGGSADGMMRFTADFRSLADDQRFIVVYPQGLVIRDEKDPQGSSNWNTIGPYDNGTDDIGFTGAIIDFLEMDYSANTSRVYACGFSLGGNFVWDLACYLGDRIAAVSSVAASMWQWTLEECNSRHRVGILSIHGTNDFYNPYSGNQYSISMSQLSEHWVLKNGSEGTPVTSQFAPGVTRFFWNRGDACYDVAHYRVQNGEHVWPSFATQVIWNYVSRYTSSGLLGCIPVDLTVNSYSKEAREVTVTVKNLPAGNFEIRSSTGGEPFQPMNPAININQNTVFPLTISKVRDEKILLQVWKKAF